MNEKYCNTNREIVTKEVLYKRLDDAIKESNNLIIQAEARLSVLRATKRCLNEYFEDLEKSEDKQ